MNCQNCGGHEDVTDFYIGQIQHVLCVHCRIALLSGARGPKRKPGRPSLGVSESVSITMSQDDWAWLDAQSGGRSENFRRLVQQKRNQELRESTRMTNSQAIAFARLACRQLELTEEMTDALHSAMRDLMDTMTNEEAEDAEANR